jgi:hypothetical protein
MTKVSEHFAQPYNAAPPAARVNARLDEATQRELQQLVRDTGASVTEVIREAIHRYYLQEAAQAHTVADDFADLIGSIAGPAELSVDYKRILADSLGRKHG